MLNNDLLLTQRNYSFLKKILLASLLLLVFFLFFWVNITLILKKQQISLSEIITVIFFNRLRKNENTNGEDELRSVLSVPAVQRAIWICSASAVAAVAFVICGSAIQSLTQNPLADATTLGFIDATIFGIICMKGIFAERIDASYYQLCYFIFALLGGLITLTLISILFKKPQHKNQHLQIIFIGLVMNMMFKTLSYLIKTSNANAVNPAFKLAIGGAENIHDLYNNQFGFLQWTAISIFILFLLTWACSNKFNLFELGEEQAKTFGVNVKLFKYFAYSLALITTTIAVTLVGNIAFVGLISTHIIRHLFRTRKYQIIVPYASVLAIFLLLTGILLNAILPFVFSSIFILCLGGIILLFLTFNNKEL
ncbi:ferrichrome ABC transporter [Candidatus Mycoplasma haematobovis]|uniref:Ferrichrome ABC transporter n=1 Tax=Candidatus Mycoplasma haematobovis TaxID=432608 RepID=A0A1A9QFJ1_9MOLU|nr:ferrichrome ABC transporter [Candidatus Mycoplasma haematobovis]